MMDSQLQQLIHLMIQYIQQIYKVSMSKNIRLSLLKRKHTRLLPTKNDVAMGFYYRDVQISKLYEMEFLERKGFQKNGEKFKDSGLDCPQINGLDYIQGKEQGNHREEGLAFENYGKISELEFIEDRGFEQKREFDHETWYCLPY